MFSKDQTTSAKAMNKIGSLHLSTVIKVVDVSHRVEMLAMHSVIMRGFLMIIAAVATHNIDEPDDQPAADEGSAWQRAILSLKGFPHVRTKAFTSICLLFAGVRYNFAVPALEAGKNTASSYDMVRANFVIELFEAANEKYFHEVSREVGLDRHRG